MVQLVIWALPQWLPEGRMEDSGRKKALNSLLFSLSLLAEIQEYKYRWPDHHKHSLCRNCTTRVFNHNEPCLRADTCLKPMWPLTLNFASIYFILFYTYAIYFINHSQPHFFNKMLLNKEKKNSYSSFSFDFKTLIFKFRVIDYILWIL